MAQAKQPGRDKSLASLHKATDTLSTMLAQEVKAARATRSTQSPAEGPAWRWL